MVKEARKLSQLQERILCSSTHHTPDIHLVACNVQEVQMGQVTNICPHQQPKQQQNTQQGERIPSRRNHSQAIDMAWGIQHTQVLSGSHWWFKMMLFERDEMWFYLQIQRKSRILGESRQIRCKRLCSFMTSFRYLWSSFKYQEKDDHKVIICLQGDWDKGQFIKMGFRFVQVPCDLWTHKEQKSYYYLKFYDVLWKVILIRSILDTRIQVNVTLILTTISK